MVERYLKLANDYELNGYREDAQEMRAMAARQRGRVPDYFTFDAEILAAETLRIRLLLISFFQNIYGKPVQDVVNEDFIDRYNALIGTTILDKMPISALAMPTKNDLKKMGITADVDPIHVRTYNRMVNALTTIRPSGYGRKGEGIYKTVGDLRSTSLIAGRNIGVPTANFATRAFKPSPTPQE